MRQREELESTGFRILNETRTQLYLAMPFLASSLDALGWVMDLGTPTIGTDAAFVRFHPNFLFRLFVEEPQRLNRTYMHLLVHCLLRHMFGAKTREDGALWDISADIAAESLIDSMEVPAVARITSGYRMEWYERLEGELRVLTAERIYRYLSETGLDLAERSRLAREFAADDHGFWERLEDEDRDEERRDRPPELALRERWEDNADRALALLSTAGREASDAAGSMERILRFSTERRADYRAFLRRFSVLREEVRVDPDSFDYGLYSYGLSLYGNLPLIEENEFRQVRRVEQLVIAIDTSASCQGQHVQRFLEETAQILLQQESFLHRVDVRILECDDRLQRDTVLTEVGQLRDYAEGFALRGGYGTDFRPVFAHVEELQRRGELSALRGLIYFTDGRGIYPTKPTRYETAFLFCEEEDYEDALVPAWAKKVYIRSIG